MDQVSDDSRPSVNHADRPSKRRRPTHEPTTNNGDDAKTRIRVTQACNECRKRKDRCDGARPSCSRCVSCGRQCRYIQSTKKRGLRGGYVRTLEILLGLIFSTIEGSETWITGLLANKTTTPSFHMRLAAEAAEDAAETSLKLWRRSHVLAEIERLGLFASAGADEDESSDRLNDRLSDSLAKVAAAPQAENSGVGRSISHESDFADQVSELVQDPMVLDDLLPQESTTSGVCQLLGSSVETLAQRSRDQLRLPSDWQGLLDTYFGTTHSWLPIAEKHELLRISYSLRANQNSVTDPTSSRGDHAFLAAALMYVLRREEYSQDIGGSPTRNEEMLHLLAFTNTLLDCTGDLYELGHVRALLLLALAQIDEKKWEHAWRTVGRAIYALVGLLNIDDPLMIPSLDESHRRTLLGCFVLEALIATRLKRRTYLKYSDVEKIGLLSTSTIEEWEPWQANNFGTSGTEGRPPALGHVVSLFNHFVRLLGMMREMQQSTGTAIAEDLAIHFQDLKGQLHHDHDLRLSPRSSPQLLNLSIAVTTMQVMIESHTIAKILPATLSELGAVMDTLERQALSNEASRYSLMPSTFEIFLPLIEEILSRQGSNVETAESRDRAMHVLGRLRRLRNAKSDIRNQSSATRLVDADVATDAAVVSAIPPQTSSLVTDTASLQPPNNGSGLWDLDDDDMLFDTMATLDSTNWIDNLPDFVRSLGSVRTASPDLQALIDGAF